MSGRLKERAYPPKVPPRYPMLPHAFFLSSHMPRFRNYCKYKGDKKYYCI
jgi:hypothetical protein